MVCELGIPAIFFSLSAADTRWSNLIALHPAACARYFQNRVQKFLKYILNSPHSPFGHLDDFLYRIVFQHRGSPHVHGIAWIRDAPKFDINSDEEVCAYIDRIIACTSNVPETKQEYIQF